MKRTTFFFLLVLLSTLSVVAQQAKQQVFFSDIDNFWVAYDSIRTTTDSLKQVRYLNKYYIGQGTPGLKAFMEAKGYTAGQWISSVRRHPKFWNSIRPNTQLAKTSASGIEPYLKKLAKLYPALRPAGMYFTIGALGSSGTTKDGMVLIGTELVTGTPQTDLSEFAPRTQAFLTRYFKTEPAKNIIPLNIHEYVHTQEKEPGTTLLGQALYEGTCDFVAELVTGKTMPLPYMAYGPKHEQALKEKFKAQMFSPYYLNWFYNQESDDPNHVPDLGYYLGYAICKAYYQQAKNKKQAVRELIELDCANEQAVEALLRKSGYYPALLNKAQLLQAYENSRPVVTSLTPVIAGDSLLDASVTEIRVNFSTEMGRGTSTDYGAGGKEQWPIVGRVGFSADKKSYTYQVKLQPGRTYSFTLTDGGFRSAEGQPLQPFTVKFKTKP